MFERFTDRTRRVVVLAQEESRALCHNYIGTEHILLGLIHEGDGVAAMALRNIGISLEGMRQQIEEIIGRGKEAPAGHIPFTPRAKKVLELALGEALELRHNYIGTEHILLGLIREGEGVAAQVLVKHGADMFRARQQVIHLLSGYQVPTAPDSASTSEPISTASRASTNSAPAAPASPAAPPTLGEIERLLTDTVRAKDEAIDAQDFEVAAQLREQERALLLQWAVRSREQARSAAPEPAPRPRRADPGGRLPAPDDSAAILIGTSVYDDPELPDMPAAGNNLLDLAETLGDPRHGGFAPRHIHVFEDPGYDIAGKVAEIAESITDTLLVYYAGHGIVPTDGQLYLAVPKTRSRREMYTAVPYQQIRHALVESPARNRVVILDCCYAGRAIDWMSDSEGLALGQLDVAGSYILTATSATRPAHVPEGARNSAFTDALLDLLRTGADDGGSLLRFTDIYPRLLRTLRGRGLPPPQQRGTDTVGDLALARNPAWTGLDRAA